MRKPKLHKFTFRKTFPLTGRFLAALIALAMLVFLGQHATRILKLSNYFLVTEVMSNKDEADFLSYLKSVNIFDIDLSKESTYLSQQYPDYRYVRLYRILPNRLYVDFAKRKPVAQLKLYRYFYVDEESVLFEPSMHPAQGEFALITGLETRLFGPKIGSKYELKELSLALRLVKIVEKSRALKNYRLSRVDVADLGNILMFLTTLPAHLSPGQQGADRLEVRLNDAQPENSIDILGGILTQVKDDAASIKYIDLRFKEPVIKFDTTGNRS